jgi:hypothetical protein
MTKTSKNRKENEWKKEPASPMPGAMISIHAYLLLLARKTCQLLPLFHHTIYYKYALLQTTLHLLPFFTL